MATQIITFGALGQGRSAMAGTYALVVSTGHEVDTTEYISAVAKVLGVYKELDALVGKAIDPGVKVRHQIVPSSSVGRIEVVVDVMGVVEDHGASVIGALDTARHIFTDHALSVASGDDVVIMIKEITEMLCVSQSVISDNLLPCVYIDRQKITKLIEKIRFIEPIISSKISLDYENKEIFLKVFYDKKITKSQMTIAGDNKEYESDGRFVISEVVFDKDKKWIAILDGKQVNILIHDKEYLLKVRSGQQKFSCEDIIYAEFHFIENKITGEKLYYITKVIDHVESKKEIQENFDEFY